MESRSTSPIVEQKEPVSSQAPSYVSKLEIILQQNQEAIEQLQQEILNQDTALKMKDAQIQTLMSEITRLKNIVQAKDEKIRATEDRIESACDLASDLEERADMQRAVKIEHITHFSLFRNVFSKCFPCVKTTASVDVEHSVSEMAAPKTHSL